MIILLKFLYLILILSFVLFNYLLFAFRYLFTISCTLYFSLYVIGFSLFYICYMLLLKKINYYIGERKSEKYMMLVVKKSVVLLMISMIIMVYGTYSFWVWNFVLGTSLLGYAIAMLLEIIRESSSQN